MNPLIESIISIKVSIEEKKALYEFVNDKEVSASSYLYDILEPTLKQLVVLKRVQTEINSKNEDNNTKVSRSEAVNNQIR